MCVSHVENNKLTYLLTLLTYLIKTNLMNEACNSKRWITATRRWRQKSFKHNTKNENQTDVFKHEWETMSVKSNVGN